MIRAIAIALVLVPRLALAAAEIESSGYFIDTDSVQTSNQTSQFAASASANVIVVAVGSPTYGTAPTVTSVTDTLGNIYTSRVARRTGDGCAEIWAAPVTATGANQVTVVTSSAGSGITITAYSVTGAEASGGATAIDTTTGTATDVSITPAAAGSLIFGAGYDYDAPTARTVTENSTKDHEAPDTNNDDSWTQYLTSPTTDTTPITFGTTAPTSSSASMVALEILAGSSAIALPGAATPRAHGSATLTAPTSELMGAATPSASASGAFAATVRVAGAATPAADSTLSFLPFSRAHVDPISDPPTGNWEIGDTGTGRLFERDRDPSGAGDLFGLVYARAIGGASYVYYLVTSSDGGASWIYRTASNSEPNADSTRAQLISATMAQDTSTYRVHYAWWPRNNSTAWYSRIALTRDGAGHVTGWNWEAENVAGPAFNVAGSEDGFAKLVLREVIDGNGARVLMLAGLDQPSGTRVGRLVAARTAAGGTALAPTGTSSWLQLGGGAGYTAVAAYNTDTTNDPDAISNINGVINGFRQHKSDVTFAQLPADRSMHLFYGAFYFNDPDADGDIRRWRFTASGANWAIDSGATNVVVAAADSTVKPCLGHAISSANYVWLVYRTTTGLHLDRVGTSGAWTNNAIPSPDTTAGQWGFQAMAVDASETRAVAMWEREWGTSAGQAAQYSAYFDGTNWTTNNETSQWTVGDWDQADAWHAAEWPGGLAAISYPYSEWVSAPRHEHIHTISMFPAAAFVLDGGAAPAADATATITTAIGIVGSGAPGAIGSAALGTASRIFGAVDAGAAGAGSFTAAALASGAASPTGDATASLTARAAIAGASALGGSASAALTAPGGGTSLPGASTPRASGASGLTLTMRLAGSAAAGGSASGALEARVELHGAGAGSASADSVLTGGSGVVALRGASALALDAFAELATLGGISGSAGPELGGLATLTASVPLGGVATPHARTVAALNGPMDTSHAPLTSLRSFLPTSLVRRTLPISILRRPR